MGPTTDTLRELPPLSEATRKTIKAADKKTTLKRFTGRVVIYAPSRRIAANRLDQASIYLDAGELD